MALGIRAYEKMRGGPARISEALGRRVGLGANQRRRALVALEAAGLARVERHSGRAPLATLTPWPPKTPTEDRVARQCAAKTT